jgi:type II secretory ATPase GspE/PulE/Tfp pilus assembly ATPase PilB-like protein
MSVVDFSKKVETKPGQESEVSALKREVEYSKRCQEITNKIHAAKNIDEILLDIKNDMLDLFGADRLTIYVVDGAKKELMSRVMSGDEVNEIRVPISASSISGYAAAYNKVINIKSAYDKKELSSVDPNLQFDHTWDQKTGYRTKQVLAVPIVHNQYILGVIQAINKKGESDIPFSQKDAESLLDMGKTVGIAIFNQKRMAKSRPNKFDYLLQNHLITGKELSKAIADARKLKSDIEKVLMKDYKVSKADIGKSLSHFYKVPFEDYNDRTPIPGELLANMKVNFLRNNNWVPLRKEDNTVIIAIDNPYHLQKIDTIKSLFPVVQRLMFHVALADDIQKYIRLFFSSGSMDQGSIDELLVKLESDEESIEEAEEAISEQDSAIVQLVNKVVLDAYARDASDIHIEPYPGKKNTEIRFRVDGACMVYQTVPYNYRNAIVSRIKIMADLDIAERRKPQDGKIKFKKYGGKDIELRVATVPTAGGLEDVVMRILAAGEPLPLDKMGFSKTNYNNFVNVVTKPYGIVFVCGPTGSGKTTTLHSALGYINKPDRKIWTAEDPVEITQVGLRQVQVQPKIGFDFAAAMRAFLRADPDVIMVGEMRDKETTHIGIEASLTGHLVFSTLHTNSAPESITRLLDMGMDPFNFADAILGILAQRLVRTLCPDCKKAYNPAKEEYDELVREYGEDVFHKNVNMPHSKYLKLHKPKGCDKCSNTGYRGRMGIHELLMGTDPMKKLIQEKATMETIREQAIADGMTTLKQDGIEKIFAGNTDLLQVRKVCIK